jgi:exopolyphosphatase / guanosine-5'-triphosphate,3'-diphosphate pyrophosphatase
VTVPEVDDPSFPSDYLASGPKILAVVDVGSSAIRMAIGQTIDGTMIDRLETLTVPVSLGADTFTRGMIRARTSQLVVQTLSEFVRVMQGYGIEPQECRAVATTAVRDARNRAVFLDRVKKSTGLTVRILEAIEETRLIKQHVMTVLAERLGEDQTMVLSIGAGGIQMVVEEGGQMISAETYRIGLMQLAGSGDKASRIKAQSRLRKLARNVGRRYDLSTVKTIAVVNVDLLGVVDGFAGKKREIEHGRQLTRQAFQRLGRATGQVGFEEFAERSGLDVGSAEQARLAIDQVSSFFSLTAAKRVIFTDTTMLESLFLDVGVQLSRLQSDDNSAATALDSAAWAIGRKYRLEEAHARNVRMLATELFDALANVAGLDRKRRRLLSVAAILHDVGYHVSARRHGRHSAYLIREAELMGLSRAKLNWVAMISQYHHDIFPGVESPDLAPLRSSERVDLVKLIAILRAADALDADHLQRVRGLRVELSTDTWHVFAQTRSGDHESFAEVQNVFAKKTALLRELFGVEMKLSEVLAG